LDTSHKNRSTINDQRSTINDGQIWGAIVESTAMREAIDFVTENFVYENFGAGHQKSSEKALANTESGTDHQKLSIFRGAIYRLNTEKVKLYCSTSCSGSSSRFSSDAGCL
jgi:hypothetical protein